jgi:hypothetical protein
MGSISAISNSQPAARYAAALSSRTINAGAPDDTPSSSIVRLSSDALAAAAVPLTTAARYKDLGASMLKQMATSATVPVAEAEVPADADNKFALSVVTSSGTKVDLTLANVGDELHFQLSASQELTEDERKVLYGLAAGFQSAIDGMTQEDPQVRLAALTRIDPKFLRSLDFHAEVKQSSEPPVTQALDFHVDSAQRKVSLSGPSGKAEVSVDTSKLASLGTKDQQAKAINSYLKQFDQAALRGRGDAKLMGMFKDAFSDMSRTSNQAPSPSEPGDAHKWTLPNEDHAVLTGLADFSASITQAPKWSNPLKLAETDSFAYEVSQSTSVAGVRRDDRSVSQTQKSHLAAQFHESLKKDGELKLDVTPQSQNYDYHQVDDSTRSNVELGYKEGRLVSATLEQSVSQSERIRKYVQGKLMADHTIPGEHTLVRDLMSTLAPYRAGENDHAKEESREDRDERRQLSLDALSENMLLLGSPWELNERDKAI